MGKIAGGALLADACLQGRDRPAVVDFKTQGYLLQITPAALDESFHTFLVVLCQLVDGVEHVKVDGLVQLGDIYYGSDGDYQETGSNF